MIESSNQSNQVEVKQAFKDDAKEEADLIKANKAFIRKAFKDGAKEEALEIKKNRTIIKKALKIKKTPIKTK